MGDFLLGLDFGSTKDPTALVVGARTPNEDAKEGDPLHAIEVVHIEKLPLGMSYVDIVSYVTDFVDQPELRNVVQIAADCTGVGKAVLDLMRSNSALSDITWSIVWTSGQNVTKDGMTFRVPKKDLVAATLILMGKGLLTCDPAIECSEDLKRELLGYVARRSGVGVKFDASSTRVNDDLVAAAVMVCWLSEAVPIDYTASASGKTAAPTALTAGNPLTVAAGGGIQIGFDRPPR